jgi:hypothetical protein
LRFIFFTCRPHRFVGRKVVKPQAFPITRWEFYGSTSLVEMAGYLEVPALGSYEFAVSSEDRFVLWLQDWWLHMQEADDEATGLPPGSWTAKVNFAAKGESSGRPCCHVLSVLRRLVERLLHTTHWACAASLALFVVYYGVQGVGISSAEGLCSLCAYPTGPW